MKRNPIPTCDRVVHRRGIAMLLVLISLMTATVLTAAYLASRDNSGPIGDNVANASAARWGAASGLNIAVAMLQTEADWRSEHTNGVLVPNLAFAQTTLNLTLQDLEDSAPPDADTTYLEALMVAAAGDIEHDASAVLIVPVPKTVDVDLAEFSMFAAGSIQMNDQSRLQRWDSAPLSRLGLPISVGTRSTAMGAVSIASWAMATDTTAWLPPGSNANGVGNASMLGVNALIMADAIPLPNPPEPGLTGTNTTRDSLSNGVTYVLTYNNVELNSGDVNGQVVVNFENRGMIVNDDLTITENSRLRISGDAVIVVHGNFYVHPSASIELAAGSTLRLYVEGNVDIGGYIGEANGQTSGINSDGLGHADVSRIHLFSMNIGSELDWRMRGSALVKGNIYAPHARVRMSNTSRLCGRIAANRIEMRNQATVLYDHALDRRTGYTNPASPIYDEDGRAKSAFLTLTSLSDDDLSAVAASESVKVRAVKRQHDTGGATLQPNVAEGESTPRPVPVTYSAVAYDTNVAHWEQ